MDPTPSQTIGPFFHICYGAKEGRLAGPDIEGERITIRCRVVDGCGEPVRDALIEIWQADYRGQYNASGFRNFGRACTDEQGACTFETIKPGRVPGPNGAFQAPHVNVNLFARGLLKQLVTRIYFAGNAANQEDPVLALAPVDRRETLLAHSCANDPGVWNFEIRLASEGETVFFDV